MGRALGAALRCLAGWGLLVLGGCSLWSPPMSQALLTAPTPGLPQQALVAEAPFFPQQDTLCGPAVLGTLLAGAGQARTLPSLEAAVYLPARQGSLQAEMLAGARRQGVVAVELPPRLDAVLAEVARGHAVGALLNLGLSWWPRWHYVALIGYDLPSATVTVHSGEHAAARWSMRSFEHMWARSGHWAMATVRPGDWPAQVDEEAALRALLGVDRVSGASGARAQAWSSALARWPQRLSLSIGLASAQADLGDWAGAARTLQAAGERHDSAAAWNNLALAQAQLGERAAARASAQRAVASARAREPQWLTQTAQTLAEVTALGEP